MIAPLSTRVASGVVVSVIALMCFSETVEYDADPAEFCPAATQLGFSAILKRLDVGIPRVPCPTTG